MEDDRERSRHVSSDSSDGSGSESSESGELQVPSLLQLSLNCVVKRLWLSEINNDWFENRALNSERVKHKLHQILSSTRRLPSSIENMLIENIDVVGNEISEEFTQLSGSKLLVYAIEFREWSDFAPLFWNFVKGNGVNNYYTVEKVFETILRHMNDDSRLISSDEISFYLSMWKTIPKDLKSRVIVNLCFDGRYDDRKFTSYPYDFLPRLLMDFSSEERKKIWMENYMELIHEIDPSRLSHLMRYIFDNDEQINEFKRQYFVKGGHADRYCLNFISRQKFEKLDPFLAFFSTNELEMEELTKRILHKYFAANRSFHALLQVLRSGGYISRVIQMAEFQHLFQIPIENVKAYCHKLIDGGNFEIMNEFLDYFLPQDKISISSFLQDTIKCFFDDNDLCSPKFSFGWLQYRLKEFNDAIEKMFANTEEAALFKKEIMFSNSVFDILAVILFTYDAEQFGYFRNCRISHVRNLSAMFLSSEENLSKWKEYFMAYAINGVRQKRWRCLFSVRNPEWIEVFAWFLDSEDKASKFRANLSMDEILLSCLRSMTMESVSQLNQILRWYYSDDEERIVIFKLRALCEFDLYYSDSARRLLLGNVSEEFYLCENDIDRLAVLRQTLRQEQGSEMSSSSSESSSS
ncbi:uncharacterized protein LOC135831415 isoform X5 [Planococcus citri]